MGGGEGRGAGWSVGQVKGVGVGVLYDGSLSYNMSRRGGRGGG